MMERLIILLTVLFVGLKLCDKIDWSWWWVISPLWIPAALAIIVAAIAFLLAVLCRVIGR